MEKNKLLFSWLAALSAAGTFAGGAEEATIPCVWTNATGGTFSYRFHAPEKMTAGKTYPLVLFLHGAGERGEDNVAQLKWSCNEIVQWFRSRKEEFFFVVGQVPNGKRWVEVDWGQVEHAMPKEPSESMANLIGLTEQLFEKAAVDRTRVYVTGISMGGYGTWDILCRKPEWFAAGMPVCGGGDPHQAWRIRAVPIWAFHGDRDGVVPVRRSRAMTAALWAIDGNIRYREYYGQGHAVWVPAYADKDVLAWFFSQRKDAKR